MGVQTYRPTGRRIGFVSTRFEGNDGVSLETEGVVVGMGARGAVTLTDPAPAGGMPVDLVTDSSLVQVPRSVMVPAGRVSATFDLSTAATTNPAKAGIIASGSCGGSSTVLSLVSTPCISAVTLSAPSLTGAGILAATVKLNAPALAGGVLVNLTSSDPAARVDGQVRVLEG